MHQNLFADVTLASATVDHNLKECMVKIAFFQIICNMHACVIPEKTEKKKNNERCAVKLKLCYYANSVKQTADFKVEKNLVDFLPLPSSSSRNE